METAHILNHLSSKILLVFYKLLLGLKKFKWLGFMLKYAMVVCVVLTIIDLSNIILVPLPNYVKLLFKVVTTISFLYYFRQKERKLIDFASKLVFEFSSDIKSIDRSFFYIILILIFSSAITFVYMLENFGISIRSSSKISFVLNTLLATFVIIALKINYYQIFSQRKNNSQDKHENFNLFLILVVSVGFSLRVLNLNILDPYTDEYAHLLTAKEMLEGFSYSEIYQRSFSIVTYPVFLAFRYLGESLWVARFVGVLFNTLAVVPLYYSMKRIGSIKIAMLSVILYSTSPWMIAISRNVREYAYYPFYFYIALLCSIYLYQNLPKKITISNLLRTIISDLKSLISVLYIATTLIYSLLIDNLSTAKSVLIFYLIMSFFFIIRLDLKHKPTLILTSIIGVLSTLFSINLLTNISSVSLIPNINRYWIKIFFLSPQQQWYYQKAEGVVIGALVFLYLILLISKRIRVEIKILMLTWLGYMYFLTFHFSRYVRPRYAFSAEIFFIPVFAIVVWLLWRLAKFSMSNYFNRNSILFSFSLFIFIFLINFTWSMQPMSGSKHGYVPITDEYHDRMRETFEYVDKEAVEEDILISTVYESYSRWRNGNSYKDYYKYQSTDPNVIGLTKDLIRSSERGWVIVDNRRGKLWNDGLPLESFYLDGKFIQYIKIDSNHVYRWK